MPEPMDSGLAFRTARDYCCAQCWAHLNILPIEGRKYIAVCAPYGEEHAGYVTKYYAETRRGESLGEKVEVRQMLEDAGVVKKENFGTPDEIIKSLGY